MATSTWLGQQSSRKNQGLFYRKSIKTPLNAMSNLLQNNSRLGFISSFQRRTNDFQRRRISIIAPKLPINTLDIGCFADSNAHPIDGCEYCTIKLRGGSGNVISRFDDLSRLGWQLPEKSNKSRCWIID